MTQYTPSGRTTGGTKWQRFLEGIVKRLGGAPVVEVGFLENATYPDGTQVAMVAAVMEYGSDTVPARPYFRDMIAAKEAEWGPAIANLLVANNFDGPRTLDIAGAAIAGQLRQSISEFDRVPLAPATIARKGHDKQLIDTGVMLASVDHRVTY